jgi:hypothetical protein
MKASPPILGYMKTQLLPAPPAPSRSGIPEPANKSAARSSKPGNRFAGQHRLRLLRADFLTVVAWASVSAAIALWLADGGLQSISSPAAAFTAAGIVAGLVGMDLVLLMLLLAARIPFIDGAVGHDRALEFHGKLGKPSLYFLLAHGLLIAIGYGMAEGVDPVTESVTLWTSVADMWLAYVSMALFIAVVVTSLVAVRRRFPYEFWYAVHLLTYAAVASSLPHQFSVGGLFAEGTWQRLYWLAICIATGAALLYYRVARPLIATSRHKLTVSRVTTVAPGVVNIEMTGRQLDRLAGAGGRFFIWRFLAPGQWWHPHPFSLSAEPVSYGPDGEGRLRITVRNLGRGSARLARLRRGTKGGAGRTLRIVQQRRPDQEQGGDDRCGHRHHAAACPAGNHPLRRRGCHGAAARTLRTGAVPQRGSHGDQQEPGGAAVPPHRSPCPADAQQLAPGRRRPEWLQPQVLRPGHRGRGRLHLRPRTLGQQRHRRCPRSGRPARTDPSRKV